MRLPIAVVLIVIHERLAVKGNTPLVEVITTLVAGSKAA